LSGDCMRGLKVMLRKWRHSGGYHNDVTPRRRNYVLSP
jgi:hypothetical protein